jgi:programmed cell death 6-interacting protein
VSRRGWQEVHGSFTAQGGGHGGEREAMLADLEAKYQSWKDLQRHLLEGEKFYTNLSGLLARLQTKVQDYCMARQMEAKDMLG